MVLSAGGGDGECEESRAVAALFTHAKLDDPARSPVASDGKQADTAYLHLPRRSASVSDTKTKAKHATFQVRNRLCVQ